MFELEELLQKISKKINSVKSLPSATLSATLRKERFFTKCVLYKTLGKLHGQVARPFLSRHSLSTFLCREPCFDSQQRLCRWPNGKILAKNSLPVCDTPTSFAKSLRSDKALPMGMWPLERPGHSANERIPVVILPLAR